MEVNYKQKYLKYKEKYLKLKAQQTGGGDKGCNHCDCGQFVYLIGYQGIPPDIKPTDSCRRPGCNDAYSNHTTKKN